MKYSWGRRSVGLVVGLLGYAWDLLIWGGCLILAAITVLLFLLEFVELFAVDLAVELCLWFHGLMAVNLDFLIMVMCAWIRGFGLSDQIL